MARCLLSVLALPLIGFTSAAFAQSYEELLKENLELKTRLAALQAVKAEDDQQNHQHPGQAQAHAEAHAGHGHACHPEDRFDFFRPFHSHCAKHKHGQIGSDDHEHDQPNLGHDRHESYYGYHFFHALRTDHAYIERSVEPRLVRTKGDDGGAVDELEFETEVFWALNNRLAFIMEVPLRYLRIEEVHEDGELEVERHTGFGDLEFGFQLVALNTRNVIVSGALMVETPTGDPDRDLGAGHARLVPFARSLIDFSRGWVLQSELGLEVPIRQGEVDNEFLFNFALGKTLLPTANWTLFNTVTPFVELNGTTILNGHENHDTVIEVTPGLFLGFGHCRHIAVGASLPVSGHTHFTDYQIQVAYFRHF